MSTASIKKNLVDDLRKMLSSDVNDENRKRLIRAGQPYVLYLDDLSFIDDAIKEFIAQKRPKNLSMDGWMGLKRLKNRHNKAGFSKAQSIAREAHQKYLNKARIDETQPASLENNLAAQTIRQKDPRTYAILGELAFLMSYGKAQSIKNEVVQALITDEVVPRIKNMIAGMLDVGHGAGGGLAVSAVTTATAFNKVETSLRQEGIEEFRRAFQVHTWNSLNKAVINPEQAVSVINLSLKYNQVVSDKGVSASYIAHARYQLGRYNKGRDRQMEGRLINSTRKFFRGKEFQDILHLHGSSTLYQKLKSYILTKFSNFKNLVVTPNPGGVALKTKGNVSDTSKTAGSPGSVKKIPGTAIPVPRVSRSSQINLHLLLDLINQRLHETIQKNMGSPKLNYRTGRFATSALVTDINRYSDNVDIGYNYMKYPYQVFEYPPSSEKGAILATRDRDPRLVIGDSVREIASEYMTQTFTVTRR